MEAELESMTKKSHDASGQLVSISQELLKKERYGDADFNRYYNVINHFNIKIILLHYIINSTKVYQAQTL